MVERTERAKQQQATRRVEERLHRVGGAAVGEHLLGPPRREQVPPEARPPISQPVQPDPRVDGERPRHHRGRPGRRPRGAKGGESLQRAVPRRVAVPHRCFTGGLELDARARRSGLHEAATGMRCMGAPDRPATKLDMRSSYPAFATFTGSPPWSGQLWDSLAGGGAPAPEHDEAHQREDAGDAGE